MSNTPKPQANTLDEIQKKIVNEHAVQLDGGLAQYVKSAIEMLQAQGKDITDYTLTQIHNPMQIKEDGRMITATWKIMRFDELEQRPTWGEDE